MMITLPCRQGGVLRGDHVAVVNQMENVKGLSLVMEVSRSTQKVSEIGSQHLWSRRHVLTELDF